MCEQVIHVPNCACGERMTLSHVPDVFVCMNCDGLQPQEAGRALGGRSAPRNKTPQDEEYASEMRRRERQWYPEQLGSNTSNRKG